MKRLQFWDLAMLDYWDNVELKQGEPQWQPEASYTDPFDEGKRGGNFPVVWKDAESGRWRMIYSVKWSPYTMMLADSEDGKHWSPLEVADVEPPGGKLAPNHVHTIEGAGAGGVFVEPDAPDGYPFKVFARQHAAAVYPKALADPNHYWHELAREEGEKRYMTEGLTVVSKDGIHWETKAEYTWDFPGWRPEPPLFMFRHQEQNRYGMTVRSGWGDRRVCIRYTDGTDLTSWSDPELLFQPDPLDTVGPIGLYGMPVFPIGQGYVGLLWVFHNSSSKPVGSFNQFFGTMDAQLAFSYDGVRFFRGHREPFLKRNPLGQPGSAQLRPASLIETEGEVRIYSEASQAPHGLESRYKNDFETPTKSIELHTLRQDGFMYLRSRGDWARLQTKPLAFWTPELQVNLQASHGLARFQITDEKSQPLEGFRFEDCVPLKYVDGTSLPVAWKKAKLDAVVGKVVRLEVELQNAELYSLSAAYHFLDANDKWRLLDEKEIDTRLFDY